MCAIIIQCVLVTFIGTKESNCFIFDLRYYCVSLKKVVEFTRAFFNWISTFHTPFSLCLICNKKLIKCNENAWNKKKNTEKNQYWIYN